ncbi:Putative Rab-GTPase-TBC domain-containing protein [Septoria linicola]|uniref:Rab-GTPase-TBC domain-containing protein n=1 Tax=Septoria linicola TaxID=215465 RepID=A0A9Q9AUT3_9PEZI|nr:Putative Rab-GTPase-TBC domain-containing protein [Septoria linicola]
MAAHLVEEQRAWQPEHTLSVAEALKEAMDETATYDHRHPPEQQSGAMGVQTPQDMPAPEAHLPLRKSSPASRMQSRKGSIPKPIFAPTHNHQVRGFGPSPVQPVPHVNEMQASSEHAFAGRDQRRPYKPAIAVLESQQQVLQYTNDPPNASPNLYRPPSSPLHSPVLESPDSSIRSKAKSLKQTKSVGDGLRNIRNRMSGKSRFGQPSGSPGRLTPDIHSSPAFPADEVRDSFRSALTSHSSFGHASSVLTTQTTHTSLSSNTGSEFVKIRTTDYDEEGGLTDLDMSVDDVLGMYEDGFESGTGSIRPSPRPSMQSATRPSIDVRASSGRSFQVTARHSLDAGSVKSLDRPQSQPKATTLVPTRPNAAHRRSQSASILILGVNARDSIRGTPPAPPVVVAEQTKPSERTSEQIISGKNLESRPTTGAPAITPRDRYGFKKTSHYITVQQYDAWNAEYSHYLERRRNKWHAMMHQYGYETEPAIRFPQKSDKVKRYVRKGIPPEFRGAAWWYYARGPREMAKNPNLYNELRQRVQDGELTDNDREHIERDLNRTFPDNVRFKPDPTTMHDAQAGAGGGTPVKEGSNLKHEVSAVPTDTPISGSPQSVTKKNKRHTDEPETPILQSLRNVLQAFAVHNPKVGYCQSLNFIAGLLLLFLSKDDSDLDIAEPKAFTLLTIVTSQHLPDTHGITLEGANIDIGVLMSCIKDALPAIWNKLDDQKEVNAIGAAATMAGGIGGLRLPTVSLATTAWFMSLFVGTLPIESVLRVWDCLFLDGSKTLFRIALAIFKAGEPEILKVSDPMEIFQVVQTIPRGMLDANALLEVCFRRRGGFASISQDVVNRRRKERKRLVQEGIMRQGLGAKSEDMVRRMRTRLKTRGGTRVAT